MQKQRHLVCVCVCETHTYRRPKKLVLLSEVTDAGLGTLSLPKEGCDLQEILLTLHSPQRNWVSCQCERVSATFRAQSITLSHWANELHCEICCVFPWHQPLGCGIHHAQPVGILDPQRHLRLSTRHSTLSAAINKYWREYTLFELM